MSRELSAKTLAILNDETIILPILDAIADRLTELQLDQNQALDVCSRVQQNVHNKNDAPLFDVVRYFCEAAILANPKMEAKLRAEQRVTSEKRVTEFFENDYGKPLALFKDQTNKNEQGVIARYNNPTRPPLGIDDVFPIHSNQELIRSYFDALASATTDLIDPDALRFRGFLLHVRINDGFLAPLQLISGLMSRFEEEWGPVLSHFRDTMQKEKSRLNFTQFQLFSLDCWLLWGPSIPTCSCSQWMTDHGRRVALQFGFGDENNSLPMVQARQDAEETTCGYLGLVDEIEGRDGALAGRYQIIVRPIPSHIASESLAAAQRKVICGDDKAGNTLSPGTAGILLDYIDHEPINTWKDNYYSAYVWMMFAVCKINDGRMEPICPVENDDYSNAWRGLLPVFIHGNIADDETYLLSKAQLVYKALGSIDACMNPGKLFETGINEKEWEEYRFVYVGAVDDPGGCGKGGKETRASRESILEIIRRLLNGPFSALGKHVILENQRIDRVQRGALSGCHLPDVVKAFYTDVSRFQK